MANQASVIAAILPVSFDCVFSVNTGFLLSTLVHLCLGGGGGKANFILLVYTCAFLASNHFTLSISFKTGVMPEVGIMPMSVWHKGIQRIAYAYGKHL